MPDMDESRLLAAVDLGSNSFHMVVAKLEGGQVQILDKLRERVQLAAGLDAERHLSDEASARALACLERFGQRLGELPRGSVRAVGTSTLRQATNGRAFLARAERALGHPIEVISGQEEARLVYEGVCLGASDLPPRRLVIDIGGGSTECILGRDGAILMAESLHMGCVSYSRRFFPDGRIDEGKMRAAEVAAALALRPIRYRFRDAGWDVALGSAGTIGAIDELLHVGTSNGVGITKKGLTKLRKAIVDSGRTEKLTLPGLSPERASVLPGGFAILAAAFESLKIASMAPARGALREGALYDLLGRMKDGDVRYAAVESLARRTSVDQAQASRVEATALSLYDQAASGWELDGGRGRRYLGWAAALHEVGLAFAHSGYHKHGSYLVEHADLAGFSKEGQTLLATLIRTHRGKLSPALFAELPEKDRKLARRLAVLLRLAVRLRRNRSDRPLPEVTLTAKKGRVTLAFPAGFLERHPLTLEDLREEAKRLAALEFELVIA